MWSVSALLIHFSWDHNLHTQAQSLEAVLLEETRHHVSNCESDKYPCWLLKTSSLFFFNDNQANALPCSGWAARVYLSEHRLNKLPGDTLSGTHAFLKLPRKSFFESVFVWLWICSGVYHRDSGGAGRGDGGVLKPQHWSRDPQQSVAEERHWGPSERN